MNKRTSIQREGSLGYSIVVLTCNISQSFHSFRTGRRRSRCTDWPMNNRDHLPPESPPNNIFEQGQRATHCKIPKPPRYWRTRKDPFETAWPTIQQWLEVDPDQTGRDLFERLQHQRPGVYPNGELRTLQRRLKEWRSQMARKLVFGVRQSAVGPSVAREAQTTSAATAANFPLDANEREHVL